MNETLKQCDQQSVGLTLKPGIYAVRFRSSLDGEGLMQFASLTTDGQWINLDTNKSLLEYEGDEILQAWLLDDAEGLRDAIIQAAESLADNNFEDIGNLYVALHQRKADPKVLAEPAESATTTVSDETAKMNDRAMVVLRFMMTMDAHDAMEWLHARLNEGYFTDCRKERAEAPVECQIGADPLYSSNAFSV